VGRFVDGVGVDGLEEGTEDGPGVGDSDGLGESGGVDCDVGRRVGDGVGDGVGDDVTTSHGCCTSGHSMKLFEQHSGLPFVV